MNKLDKWIIILFNIVLKRFRRNISLRNGGSYMLSREVINYECCYCKSGLRELSWFNNKRYGYEIQDIDIKYQLPQISEVSFQVYGWIIEKRYKSNLGLGWSNMKPHRIYTSEKSAIDSIVQIKGNGYQDYSRLDMRIRPLYHVDPVLDNRRVTINKILEK